MYNALCMILKRFGNALSQHIALPLSYVWDLKQTFKLLYFIWSFVIYSLWTVTSNNASDSS